MGSFFANLDSSFARSFIWIFMPIFFDKFLFWEFHKNTCQTSLLISINHFPGMFTCTSLLRKSPAHIDVFEYSPVPYGLVRYGVAPDHQEVRYFFLSNFSKVTRSIPCDLFRINSKFSSMKNFYLLKQKTFFKDNKIINILRVQ